MVRNVRSTPLQGQARSHDNLEDEWMCAPLAMQDKAEKYSLPREETLTNG